MGSEVGIPEAVLGSMETAPRPSLSLLVMVATERLSNIGEGALDPAKWVGMRTRSCPIGTGS